MDDSVLVVLVLLVVVVVLSVELTHRVSLLQSLAWANKWKDKESKERVSFIVAERNEVLVVILSVGVEAVIVEERSYTLCPLSHFPMGSRSGSHCQERA